MGGEFVCWFNDTLANANPNALAICNTLPQTTFNFYSILNDDLGYYGDDLELQWGNLFGFESFGETFSVGNPVLTQLLFQTLGFAMLLGIVITTVIAILLALRGSKKTGDRRRQQASPLVLKMFWLNEMSPPSYNNHDANIYLTDHDYKLAEPTLKELLNFGNAEFLPESCKFAKMVPFANDRDEDDHLVLPSKTYPRQTHYQFEIFQRSLQKQNKTFGFNAGNNGGRVATAITTWMMHLSAGIASILHSFMVIPIILFAPESFIRRMTVQPARVVFCKNLLPEKPKEQDYAAALPPTLNNTSIAIAPSPAPVVSEKAELVLQ